MRTLILTPALDNRYGEGMVASRIGLKAKALRFADNAAPWPSGRCARDRKSTRLNSSHVAISYAVFCLKKKNPAPKQNLERTRKSVMRVLTEYCHTTAAVAHQATVRNQRVSVTPLQRNRPPNDAKRENS